MTVMEVARALERSPFALAIRDSTFGFALLITIHVLALGMFLGTVMLVDLRLVRRGIVGAPVSDLVERLLPWTRGSFTVMALSGVLLFCTEAAKCCASTAFRTKMALILLAAVNVWFFHRRTYQGSITENQFFDPAAVGPCGRNSVAAVVDRSFGRGSRGGIRLLRRSHEDEVGTMNLVPILEWTRDTPVAVAIRHSGWMLPAIESAHLLGYAGVIGTSVAIDFRILNIGLRNQTAGQIAAQLTNWMAASLALSAVTGALMFSYKPFVFAANGALPSKLGLVVVAILFHYAILLRVARTDPPASFARLAAACSLALWLAVALAGMILSLELFAHAPAQSSL